MIKKEVHTNGTLLAKHQTEQMHMVHKWTNYLLVLMMHHARCLDSLAVLDMATAKIGKL